MIRQKASRGKLLAAFGVDDFLRTMWERFTVQKAWARTVLEAAARVAQLGTEGSWQKESPYKVDFELLRKVKDLRFDGSLMRKAGDWEEFFRNEKLSVWASVKVRECFNEAEQIEED